MIKDIKNSIVVEIEHVGKGIAYELQYLEDDTYQTFWTPYDHFIGHHYPEHLNPVLIAKESDSNIIDMIELDIDNEEIDFYVYSDGVVIPLEEYKNYSTYPGDEPIYL